MKNRFILFCCLFLGAHQISIAQNRPEFYLGGGYLTQSNTSQFSNSIGGELGFYFPFYSKTNFSLGINLNGGYYTSKVKVNNEIAPVPFSFLERNVVKIDTTISPTSSIKQFGLGPRADFKLGNKLVFSAAVDAGVRFLNQDAINYMQYMHVKEESPSKSIYQREKIDLKKIIVLPKIRFAYPINDQFNVWAEGNYNQSKYEETHQYINRVDAKGNPLRDIGQLMEAGYTNENNVVAWKSVGAQLGVAIKLGKANKKNNLTKIQNPTNPINEIIIKNSGNKNEEIRTIVPINPKNNSQFKDGKEIKSLDWKLIGSSIKSPIYHIELVQLGKGLKPIKSFYAKTSKLSINLNELTKGQSLLHAQYRWNVIESSTGIQSSPQFFAINNCNIQFTIDNEEISCLGYVGENRKYRVCFNSTYSSSSGDLTYAQSGSGLTIFDQNYNVLNYSLTNPQPNLITQTGSGSTSVQYCFEVEVSNNVTAIGIGLQGDDLDPSPILCQPGVSTVIDSLPDCICEDCDDMVLNFDPVQISQIQNPASAFSFNGNLNINQPIYGIEVQVLSYQFNANPSPCSAGVASIEQSGMFLRNGSTINNSTDITLINSTSDPNNNTNASKVIKYISNAALSGNIPMNLVLGLPTPAAGFDANCCQMDYEVCFKIVVYYDSGYCKSCVFTKCFQFTN